MVRGHDPFSLAHVQSDGLTVVAMSDALFGLDVLLNFRTAIEDEEIGIYLTSGRTIAARYVRGWFWVDLLSAIPFELFASHDAEATNLAKAFKFFRLLRMVRAIKLLRLMRVMRIINRLEMAFMVRHHVKALVSYFGVCLLASHWIACCYFAVGESYCERHDGAAVADACDDTWIGPEHAAVADLPPWDQYVAALYWTIMAVTTVGFGDVASHNTSERLFSIFTMIVGASMFAFGVSHIVNLLSEISSRSRKFRIKLDRMNQYMEQNKLPTELRVEIRDFLHQIGRKMRERASIREEEELLSDLSFGLRAKLVLAINKHTLLQMPLFQHADDKFVSEIAMRMRSVYSSVGECIVTEGDVATEMYFISRRRRGRHQRGHGQGDARRAAERRPLLRRERGHEARRARSATVRAVTFTEMRSLDRESFLEAAAGYPAILEQSTACARTEWKTRTRSAGRATRVA